MSMSLSEKWSNFSKDKNSMSWRPNYTNIHAFAQSIGLKVSNCQFYHLYSCTKDVDTLIPATPSVALRPSAPPFMAHTTQHHHHHLHPCHPPSPPCQLKLLQQHPITTSSPLMPCTLSQLLPLSKFTGEGSSKDSDGAGESFQEWLEQFELVAETCWWDEKTKLVNLTMQLRGLAYLFYCTCKPEQRQDFDQLKGALSKHFTPVRIPVVDSNLFHERTQRKNETVDEYAQELKQLFYKAYLSKRRRRWRRWIKMSWHVSSWRVFTQTLKGRLLEQKGIWRRC